MPISLMSPSVLSSLDVEHKNMASEYSKAKLFFISLMSKELPWKPCTKTKRCTPLYGFGAQGTWSKASRCASATASLAPRGAHLSSKRSGRKSILGWRERSSTAGGSGAFSAAALRTSSAILWWDSQRWTSSVKVMSGRGASLTMEALQRETTSRSQTCRRLWDTARGDQRIMFSTSCQVSNTRHDAMFISYTRCAATDRELTCRPSLVSNILLKLEWVPCAPPPPGTPLSVEAVDMLSPLTDGHFATIRWPEAPPCGSLPWGSLPCGSCVSSARPRSSRWAGVRHSLLKCLSHAAILEYEADNKSTCCT
mmetsp:Transcript_123849/g.263909  ORF Transcript_123849/g.263909 Transcript_123849/m.263909 type:complete len:310 (-) Transcript_123849:1042-1971(-)